MQVAKYMDESPVYTMTVDIAELLTSPIKTANIIRSLTVDLAQKMPPELYISAVTWMEQNLQVFAQETQNFPPWMKRIYCDMGRMTSLRDNTRCINCCNNFCHATVHSFNKGHNMVVLERVPDGMRVEIMTSPAMMSKYGDDIWYIIEQSMIHHAEEAEEAAY